MVGLFATCLFILIFGLNLKVISRTLTLTTESPKDVVTQLTKMGLKIVYAGIAIVLIGGIIFVGIAKCGVEPCPQDGITIASTGNAVLALGFTTIIGARGRPETVRKGARIVICIGAGLFLVSLIAYLIMAYLPKG